MKKKYLFMFLGLTAMLTFNACDPKPDLDLDKELKFSPLTVEQQKQKIEDNGIEFVERMDDLLKTPALVAIKNFAMVFEGNSHERMYAPLRSIATDIRNGNSNVLVGLERQMKVIQENYEEDDGPVFGEYIYNFDTEEFDLKKELENKAIFHLPASPEAMENRNNNGLISFEFTESTIRIPDSDEEMYYPASASLSIKVDDNIVLEASFTGKYFDDGVGSDLKQTLKIGDFSWEAKVTNDKKKKISAEYEFKKGKNTLIRLAAETTGSFSYEDFDKSEGPDDVLDKIAINCQVMNIAIKAGVADVKGFAEAMNSVDYKNQSEEAAKNQEAVIMNQHVVGYGYFTDDNKKFASVDFYVEKYTYEGYSYYNVVPRFVLSDKSKVSLEKYVKTGFDDLIEKIEEVAENHDLIMVK